MSKTSIIVVFIVLLIGAYIYTTIRKIKKASKAVDNKKIKILTAANFQNQIKQGVTLVDFWADWCMPCKMMVPVLNGVAEEIDDKVSIAKINIEHAQSVAQKYMVSSIPTIILFKNGKEMNRFIGIKSKEFLLKQLKMYN